jgi:predicted phosphohydrolase
MEDGTKIKDVICPDPSGILILAGDLTRVFSGTSLFVDSLKEICSKFNKVIFVPGNHEYYCIRGKESMESILLFIRSLTNSIKNLIVLDNESYTIGDTIIFGSTFWSYTSTDAWHKIPIYVGNKGSERLITNHEYNELHFRSLLALEKTIKCAEEQNKKMVVVTHYPPTIKGTVDPKYHDNSTRSMYYSHSDHILENNVIMRWIYGHTDYNGRYEKREGVYKKLMTNQAVTKDFRNPLILII